MRTKLTAVVLDGDPGDPYAVVVPAGIEVQPKGRGFELIDPPRDSDIYDYWFRLGVELDRSQVEDGKPYLSSAPKKWWVRGLVWIFKAALLLTFVSLMSNAPPWAGGMLIAIAWLSWRK